MEGGSVPGWIIEVRATRERRAEHRRNRHDRGNAVLRWIYDGSRRDRHSAAIGTVAGEPYNVRGDGRVGPLVDGSGRVGVPRCEPTLLWLRVRGYGGARRLRHVSRDGAPGGVACRLR